MSFINFKKYVLDGYHLPILQHVMSDEEQFVYHYADELHALFCEGEHEGPQQNCDWDEEEADTTFNPWLFKTHHMWFNIGKTFIQKNITPDNAWDAFSEIYFNGEI